MCLDEGPVLTNDTDIKDESQVKKTYSRSYSLQYKEYKDIKEEQLRLMKQLEVERHLRIQKMRDKQIAKLREETSYARSLRNTLIDQIVQEFDHELLKSEQLLINVLPFPHTTVGGIDSYSLKRVKEILYSLLRALKEDISHVTRTIDRLKDIDDKNPTTDPKDPDFIL